MCTPNHHRRSKGRKSFFSVRMTHPGETKAKQSITKGQTAMRHTPHPLFHRPVSPKRKKTVSFSAVRSRGMEEEKSGGLREASGGFQPMPFGLSTVEHVKALVNQGGYSTSSPPDIVKGGYPSPGGYAAAAAASKAPQREKLVETSWICLFCGRGNIAEASVCHACLLPPNAQDQELFDALHSSGKSGDGDERKDERAWAVYEVC